MQQQHRKSYTLLRKYSEPRISQHLSPTQKCNLNIFKIHSNDIKKQSLGQLRKFQIVGRKEVKKFIVDGRGVRNRYKKLSTIFSSGKNILAVKQNNHYSQHDPVMSQETLIKYYYQKQKQQRRLISQKQPQAREKKLKINLSNHKRKLQQVQNENQNRKIKSSFKNGHRSKISKLQSLHAKYQEKWNMSSTNLLTSQQINKFKDIFIKTIELSEKRHKSSSNSDHTFIINDEGSSHKIWQQTLRSKTYQKPMMQQSKLNVNENIIQNSIKPKNNTNKMQLQLKIIGKNKKIKQKDWICSTNNQNCLFMLFQDNVKKYLGKYQKQEYHPGKK